MATTLEKTHIESNQELEKLASGTVSIIAKYAFQNPYSINGPFGTLELTITEDSSSVTKNAFGDIVINTLWGLGSYTNLKFTGPAKFNGSTGYTSIEADSKGTITVRPNPPKSIEAKVSITLQPGFQEGTLSVEGFFSDFAIKATYVHYQK
ncbi:hypothetical protein ACQY1Q_04430 [Tenacibaculum sp. TC6]|uniref:hypothetical protein n=1 Tax=Tenacibaculum sp. TC6 TaxID=3423223 RepID=UPI003D367849